MTSHLRLTNNKYLPVLKHVNTVHLIYSMERFLFVKMLCHITKAPTHIILCGKDDWIILEDED